VIHLCRMVGMSVLLGYTSTIPVYGANSQCGEIAQLALSAAIIVSTEEVPTGSLKLPPNPLLQIETSDAPSFCRVKGVARPTTDSNIGFEVWMPLSDWDGRFVQVGNGGLAGSINFMSMLGQLKSRHAVAATDDGHTGIGTDGSWALGHPEKVKDFGYRAVHETSVLAKNIIAKFYGSNTGYAYFTGCSEGGREALMEAQRFPRDFNGILAGSSAHYWTRLMAAFAWNAQAQNDPASYISEPRRRTVENAALEACGFQNGVRSDFIQNPLDCKFDPSVLQCKGQETDACLTAPQVEALKKIYSGPVNSRTQERVSAGYEPGTEAEPGLPGISFASYVFGTAPGVSLAAAFSSSFYGNFVFQKPDWKLASMRFDEDLATVEKKVGTVLNADNPDLTAFRRAGGKLIQYHGWNDGSPPPRSSVIYYEDVAKTMGGLAAVHGFYQLYMVPGMMHCGGGPGPNSFGNFLDPLPAMDAEHNVFLALQRWTEKGAAPKKLFATKYRSDQPSEGVLLTRPLCPYPEVAVWNGKGKASEAETWSCATPIGATGKPR